MKALSTVLFKVDEKQGETTEAEMAAAEVDREIPRRRRVEGWMSHYLCGVTQDRAEKEKGKMGKKR